MILTNVEFAFACIYEDVLFIIILILFYILFLLLSKGLDMEHEEKLKRIKKEIKEVFDNYWKLH